MFKLTLFNKPKTDFAFETLDISKLDQQSVNAAFVRTFKSKDGKTVLAYLKALTFERALPATAPDEQIRYYEGQRALVGSILRIIERGKRG